MQFGGTRQEECKRGISFVTLRDIVIHEKVSNNSVSKMGKGEDFGEK